MSINKYQPHIIVIAEDDANRNIANGFLNFSYVKYNNIQVLSAGKIGKSGWRKVIDWFINTQVNEMRNCLTRIAILLIDFDSKQGYKTNLNYANKQIPNDLQDRVFILGVWSQPENLKSQLGSYEYIGEHLAEDCYNNTSNFWGHELLNHNSDELSRMRSIIRAIIF